MLRVTVVYVALCILLHPLFFAIYRMGVFSAMPRDDYARYLLWLVGIPGWVFPESPYCYRILSMVIAAPFYALPAIGLTNMPEGLSPEYLRATAALSMVAYLAWIATGMLAYATARQARLGQAGCLIAAGLASVLMAYVQFPAIDPLALMLIAACVLMLDRPIPFAVLLGASVFTNEKVALVLAIWLGARCILSPADRPALLRPFTFATLAVLVYAATVMVLHLPGNAYQRDVGSYGATLLTNLAAYATPRGMMLNIVPIAILGGLAMIGRPVGRFRRIDVVVIPLLAAVALVVTQFFQAGRIVMHAAPIFVVPAAAAIEAGWRSLPGRSTI